MKKLIVTLALISASASSSAAIYEKINVQTINLFAGQMAYAQAEYTIQVINESDQNQTYSYRTMLCPESVKCDIKEKPGFVVWAHDTVTFNFFQQLPIYYTTTGMHRVDAQIDVTVYEGKFLKQTGYINVYPKNW